MATTGNSCIVKHGARTHEVPSGSVAALKLKLAELTALAPAEMKLLSRGKVVHEGEVAPGTKLMLTRCAVATKTVSARIVEIVTGRSTSHAVHIPLSATHDDIVALALKALGAAADSEVCTLRLYLPHIHSLMRVDLALGDYTGGASGASKLDIYLVPCARGLRSDSLVDETALAAATAAELEAAAMSRAEAEAELEAAVLRQAHRAMPPLLPPSIVEVAAEEAAAASSEDSSDGEDLGGAASSLERRPRLGASSSSSSSKEAPPAAETRSAASLVPAKLRTGLMPSLDEVQMVPVPLEVLAELEAYEAYDAEMRELAALPYSQARELMVSSEEARLEERCAILVSTLAPSDPHVADEPPSPYPQPTTPVRGHRGWGEGSKQPSPVLVPRTQQRSRRCRSPISAAFPSSTDCALCFSEDEEVYDGTCTAAPASTAPELEGSKCYTEGELIASRSQPRKRCKTCDCRLPLTAHASSICKCGHSYCAAHMHEHKCSFDFRSGARKKLDEANPKVQPSKLERL